MVNTGRVVVCDGQVGGAVGGAPFPADVVAEWSSQDLVEMEEGAGQMDVVGKTRESL